MQTSSLDHITRQLAIQGIKTYQKHLSPRKGFACPHRLLYGGKSCSEYVKQQFLQTNLSSALKLSQTRFKACVTASQTLAGKRNFKCVVIPCCIPL